MSAIRTYTPSSKSGTYHFFFARTTCFFFCFVVLQTFSFFFFRFDRFKKKKPLKKPLRTYTPPSNAEMIIFFARTTIRGRTRMLLDKRVTVVSIYLSTPPIHTSRTTDPGLGIYATSQRSHLDYLGHRIMYIQTSITPEHPTPTPTPRNCLTADAACSTVPRTRVCVVHPPPPPLPLLDMYIKPPLHPNPLPTHMVSSALYRQSRKHRVFHNSRHVRARILPPPSFLPLSLFNLGFAPRYMDSSQRLSIYLHADANVDHHSPPPFHPLVSLYICIGYLYFFFFALSVGWHRAALCVPNVSRCIFPSPFPPPPPYTLRHNICFLMLYICLKKKKRRVRGNKGKREI